MTKVPVFYDCDPGHDDAMAILLATQHPGINLLGISTVAGNQTVDKTTENALKMLQVCRAGHVPVVKGSAVPLIRKSQICPAIHGKSGLDGSDFPPLEISAKKDNAIVFMFQTIEKHFEEEKEKVTVVATGCLTNVALLLAVFPKVKNYISEIVVMGGAVGLGNTKPKAEFNIEIDPEASAMVIEQKDIPVTMVTIEVTHTVLVTEEIFDSIKSLNSPFSKLIVGLLEFFKETYIRVFGFSSPPLHDPCAMMYVVHPEVFECKKYNVKIERKSEFCDGATVIDIHDQLKREKNTNVCVKANVKRFWEIMLDAIKSADEISPMNAVTGLKRKRESQEEIVEEEKPQKKLKV